MKNIYRERRVLAAHCLSLILFKILIGPDVLRRGLFPATAVVVVVVFFLVIEIAGGRVRSANGNGHQPYIY